MKPRIRIGTLMLAVPVCAAATNVFIQASRLRFVKYVNMKFLEPPYEPFLSLTFFVLIGCGVAYVARSTGTRA
jgi:hypothetical protein